MQLLKEKIRNDGYYMTGEILKVDSFLNHQIDIALLNELGKEFKRRFNDVKIDKILTIEASGIGVAAITSLYFDNVPVLFAKKQNATNLSADTYNAEVFSYTKNKTNTIRVDKKYLKKGENVLIIDDFLAKGNAAIGLCSLAEQAGANVAGIGIVIEKSFQDGRKRLVEKGFKVESLARIKSINDGAIEFL